jgi:glycosyl transferase family 87
MLRSWSGKLTQMDQRRILVFLGTVWSLAFTLLMVDTNFADPKNFAESDYITTFHVAGYLMTSGQAESLYPAPNDSSFTRSRFDEAAHRLIPSLPEKSTAIFAYTPLVAWMFGLLGKLSPNISLLIWQMISVLGLWLSAVFLSHASNQRASDILFLSSLFLPVITTLWSGQVSLVFGLLPLSAGYFWFKKDRPFLAGLAWSLLSLKPQFVFVPALVSFALVLAGRFKCCIGFFVGVIALIGLTVVFVPMTVTTSWLYSLHLRETLSYTGVYKIREYLVTSLPADILLQVPIELSGRIKWPIYIGAATLWLAGAWRCKKLINSTSLTEFQKISLTLTMALLLLPLTSPYLLYYDLCVFLPSGVILLETGWPALRSLSLRFIALIGWAGISAYMLTFMTLPERFVQPLLLQLILLSLLYKLNKTLDSLCPVPIVLNR